MEWPNNGKLSVVCPTRLITHHNHIRSFKQANIAICARGQFRIRWTGDLFGKRAGRQVCHGAHGYGVNRTRLM